MTLIRALKNVTIFLDTRGMIFLTQDGLRNSRIIHLKMLYYIHLCLTTYNLGNTLGDYFDQISCGVAAGVSVVTGKKIWDFPSLPTEYKGNKFLNRDRTEVQRLEKYEKYHFDFLMLYQQYLVHHLKIQQTIHMMVLILA